MKVKHELQPFKDVLAQVLSAEWSGEVANPLFAPGKDLRILGELKGKVGRDVYSACISCKNSGADLLAKCRGLQVQDTIKYKDTLDDMITVIEKLRVRKRILSQLFWEDVASQYQLTMLPDSNTHLGIGWQIAVSNDLVELPLFEDGHIARCLFARIVDIFTTEQKSQCICPVHETFKGGKVIGKITDNRVKALAVLLGELNMVGRDLVPVHDMKEIRAWVTDQFNKHKFSDLGTLVIKLNIVSKQVELLNLLVFELVHEDLSLDDSHKTTIGLGEDWSIIQFPDIRVVPEIIEVVLADPWAAERSIGLN